MAEYLNLIGKERNAPAFISTYGKLYGEGVYVLATSNFKFPKDRNPQLGGSRPLTIREVYTKIRGPINFAYAEARRTYNACNPNSPERR